MAHLFPTPHSFSKVTLVVWNWLLLSLFTPQKLASVTSQGFFFREFLVKHLLAHQYVWLSLFYRWTCRGSEGDIILQGVQSSAITGHRTHKAGWTFGLLCQLLGISGKQKSLYSLISSLKFSSYSETKLWSSLLNGRNLNSSKCYLHFVPPSLQLLPHSLANE